MLNKMMMVRRYQVQTTLDDQDTTNSPQKNDGIIGSCRELMTTVDLGYLFLDPSLVWMDITMILGHMIVKPVGIRYQDTKRGRQVMV